MLNASASQAAKERGMNCSPREAKGARVAYTQQRRHAERRGIAWLFTFDTWCEVWERSGRWAERGRGRDRYVMCRNGDVGPYEPSNVSIKTSAENSSEGLKNVPRVMRRVGPIGQGKGWKFNKACKSKPYEVRCCGKHLGMFATQEEAEAAYRSASLLALNDRRAA